MTEPRFTAGVLTVSDKGSEGAREDKSGDAIAEMLMGAGIKVVERKVVPDEVEKIKAVLIEWCDKVCLNLIVTTGGTGFAPRDVTPEATIEVVERQTPGISEAIRLEGLEKTPKAMLSRAVSGLRGKTLIVNVPGSEKGARESVAAILPALDHGLETLAGEGGECGG